MVESSYYADADLTMSLHDPPYYGSFLYAAGSEIYTKIVFHMDIGVQPTFSYSYPAEPGFQQSGGAPVRYRMRERSVAVADLESGDAKPLDGENNVFVCKYVLPEIAFGDGGRVFSTFYGHRKWLANPPSVQITRNGSEFYLYGQKLLIDLLAGSDAAHPAPESGPRDFVGRVGVPFSIGVVQVGLDMSPIPGVTVTIVSGTRTGEQVVTDEGGYYLFPDVAGDDLHIRVEKEHFEPREVIVHRTSRTTPRKQKHGANARDRGTGWIRPGVVLIGQQWPDEVRFVLEEVVVPDDLLFYIDDGAVDPHTLNIGGSYTSGIIILSYNHYNDTINAGTVFHELFHAHQDAFAILELGSNRGHTTTWYLTAEGKAYQEAEDRDWRQFGMTSTDWSNALLYPGNTEKQLIENPAQVAAYYWGSEYFGRINFLQTQAPNRLKWAQEWLHKQ
ncbi:carboxypeptidase regulatory-like domain-containing protein [Candidatus Poribacteria bacterium]|nr:carboxypeptidase regulatory-like domain-containing protein [Candidatus Poribacteria bacterium]MYG07256.1 carboxypeptidase regulatory-like domain-containing protein [Candidatus Poribacteria bacterium]